MGFLDVLSDLNRQNFGGGLAQYGKSLSDLKQNQDLVKGVANFRERKRIFEDEELKTTSEQLVDIDNKKEQITGNRSLLDQAVNASMNLVKTYDKIGAYQNLYQPFITSFATLGEEGLQVANTLSRELADKVDMVEKRGTASLIEQQYKNEVMESAMNTVKFDEMIKKIDKDANIMNMVSWMVNNPLMDLIPGEDAKTTDMNFYKKHVQAKKTLLDAARQQFGDVNDESLASAFQMSLGYVGKSLQFDYDPAKDAYYRRQADSENKKSLFALSNSKARLQALDAEWQSFDDTKINAWRAFLRTGIAPEGYDKKSLEDMTAKFGPAGEFVKNDSYIRILGGDPNWGKTTLKDIEVSFDVNGTSLIKQRHPLNGADGGISRIMDPTSFVTGNFGYSPRDNTKVIEAKKEIIKNTTGRNTPDNLFEGYNDNSFDSNLIEMLMSGSLKHPVNK